MLTNTKEDKNFISILADGKFHMTVPEGTEGAVTRTYETSDGKSGTKTELVYTELKGFITKVNFFEGDFGNNIQVTVEDEGEKPVVLSMGTATSFGEDFMKKLLAIKMDKKVKIAPFSFEDDNKKSKKGVTIYQMNEAGDKAEKVQNYFYNTETKETLHGFPEPKQKKNKPFTKDEWKLYFAQVRQFLVEKITEHFKLDEQTDKVASEVDGF